MRLLWAVALLGCGDPPPEAPAPAAPTLAPVTAASEAPASAAPASAVDAATRRVRFEQRPVIEPLKAWPAPWRGLVSGLGGRLLGGAVAVRTRAAGEAVVTEITLSFRVFGQDAEVEASLLKALKAVGFGGDRLPEDPVEIGPERWTVEVARLKGEAPRETQFDLTWRREPPRIDNAAPCKKPPPLPLPAEAPAWLDPVTNARSTRRRVATRMDVGHDTQAVELTMLFQNGYAQDEAVGHYTALAQQRGYRLSEGSGLKQTWRHSDGSELAWWPTRRELGLGCELAGPVLEISWKNK